MSKDKFIEFCVEYLPYCVERDAQGVDKGALVLLFVLFGFLVILVIYIVSNR